MATNEDILEAEWRNQVMSKLTSLENTQNSIQKDINEMKINYASNVKLEDLSDKVEKLQLYKAKATGVILSLNLLAIFIGWLIQSYIFYIH